MNSTTNGIPFTHFLWSFPPRFSQFQCDPDLPLKTTTQHENNTSIRSTIIIWHNIAMTTAVNHGNKNNHGNVKKNQKENSALSSDVTLWKIKYLTSQFFVNFITHFIYQQQQQATLCTHLAQNTLHYTTHLTYTQTRATFHNSSSTTYHLIFNNKYSTT